MLLILGDIRLCDERRLKEYPIRQQGTKLVQYKKL